MIFMREDDEKPEDKPIEPANPNSQPGTPMQKPCIKPVVPSENPGTSIPFERKKNRK